MSGAELAHPRPDGVPPAVLWVIRSMNLIFNFLNALWFSKMLKGAIKVSSLLQSSFVLSCHRGGSLQALSHKYVMLSVTPCHCYDAGAPVETMAPSTCAAPPLMP